ncbi:hypothetical protein [Agromyces bauzanensis]
MTRRTLAGVVAAVLLVGLLQVADRGSTAEAAVASDFDPGMIISDGKFFDGGAMSSAQIQSFLASKVPECRAGYTCLKDYRQDTWTRTGEVGRCAGYQGAPSESAAVIIQKVGVACGVSQMALLVLLEKEQSLVTDTWPTSIQYRSATGYGCPDTAACDSEYYGFYNQVYMAALQFKRYAANPTGWNHIAGRANTIRFHPDAACGSSTVYIQNQATAGLYNYTPYQPNAAALNNLYGTGDACSAYGNRNFWRLYTDWFGNTTDTAFVRTADNPQVYLIVDGMKHPVPSMTIYGSYRSLGGLSFVSDAYLARFTTGTTLGRIVRSPDGSLYFVDVGIKVWFETCDQVVDYGGSCNAGGFVQLTMAQIDALVTGPSMKAVMATVTGRRYFVDDGIKHEIYDVQSQVERGIPQGQNVLTDESLDHLRLGAPVIRDSVFVRVSEAPGEIAFFAGGIRYPIDSADVDALGIPERNPASLGRSSLALLPSGSSAFEGVVSSPDGRMWMIGSRGREPIDPVRMTTLSPAIPVSEGFTAGYPELPAMSIGTAVKSSASATVYIVFADRMRPVASWSELTAFVGASPTISTYPKAFAARWRVGPLALAPGWMYRSDADPTVYIIDGLTGKITLTSFLYSGSVGFANLRFTDAAALGAQQTASAPLSFGVVCGGASFVGVEGRIRPLDASQVPLYPIPYQTLDPATCRQLSPGDPASNFIRTSNGTIYQLLGGEKRPISTMERYLQLSTGQRPWMQVHDALAALIPTGSTL